MEPYGGLGAANALNMGIDQIVDAIGRTGPDFFAQLEGRMRDQVLARQAEMASLAQDFAYVFSGPSGERVLTFLIEKTLLNPVLPIEWGKGFADTGPYRAAREGENMLVFQIVAALHQHRQAQGVTT